MSALNRLAAGRWLLADGDTTAAVSLLLLHEVDLPQTLHPLAPASMMLSGHSLWLLSTKEGRGGERLARRYRSMARTRADLLGAEELAFEPCPQRPRHTR